MRRRPPRARSWIPQDSGNAIDTFVDDEGPTLEADAGDFLHGPPRLRSSGQSPARTIPRASDGTPPGPARSRVARARSGKRRQRNSRVAPSDAAHI